MLVFTVDVRRLDADQQKPAMTTHLGCLNSVPFYSVPEASDGKWSRGQAGYVPSWSDHTSHALNLRCAKLLAFDVL